MGVDPGLGDIVVLVVLLLISPLPLHRARDMSVYVQDGPCRHNDFDSSYLLFGIALAYRCFARLRILYLAYALVVVLLLVWPLCKRHVESMARHMIFCAALGLVPAIHPFFIFSQEELRTIMPYVFAMFMCYGVGAAVFTSKWPECKWPERFDILGHSHQVWHVFVVLAAVIWVEATLMMRRRSRDVGCELDSST